MSYRFRVQNLRALVDHAKSLMAFQFRFCLVNCSCLCGFLLIYLIVLRLSNNLQQIGINNFIIKWVWQDVGIRDIPNALVRTIIYQKGVVRTQLSKPRIDLLPHPTHVLHNQMSICIHQTGNVCKQTFFNTLDKSWFDPTPFRQQKLNHGLQIWLHC